MEPLLSVIESATGKWISGLHGDSMLKCLRCNHIASHQGCTSAPKILSALFARFKMRKQPNHSRIDEWVNKMDDHQRNIIQI